MGQHTGRYDQDIVWLLIMVAIAWAFGGPWWIAGTALTGTVLVLHGHCIKRIGYNVGIRVKRALVRRSALKSQAQRRAVDN